jgi:hypothetical protein
VNVKQKATRDELLLNLVYEWLGRGSRYWCSLPPAHHW